MIDRREEEKGNGREREGEGEIKEQGRWGSQVLPTAAGGRLTPQSARDGGEGDGMGEQ